MIHNLISVNAFKYNGFILIYNTFLYCINTLLPNITRMLQNQREIINIKIMYRSDAIDYLKMYANV